MLIADGGGGYGGTDWMSKDVRFMWSTIANQETDPHFDVVGGWRKTADLTLAHLGQVQKYRDNLASVWPPSKSAAAAEYITRLDKLIVDLQATHDAAAANYTAFSTVTLTLSLARNKLKPILEQYEANEQLNVDWRAKQDAVVAKSAVTGLTPAFRPPPVSTARQEELNNQARAIMYDLSSTVISGQAALKKPQPYMPGGENREDPPQGSNTKDSGSGFAVPPVIPAPGASNGGGPGSPVTPGHSSAVAPPHAPVTSPANPGTVGGGTGSGPVLGGVGPTPVITPPPPAAPPIPGPGPIPGPTPPPLPPGIIGSVGGPGFTPSGGLPTGGGRVPLSPMTKPGMGTGAPGRMTMPSGGVIGANPGSGVIGQMPSAGTGARAGGSARVNPVGGVIGQQGGGPAGRSSSSGAHGPSGVNSAALPHKAGQRRGRREGDTEATAWDPDNPWATDQGVDPVVLPPDAPRPIDPGPAIGYSR
jgi:hypothetical protein